MISIRPYSDSDADAICARVPFDKKTIGASRFAFTVSFDGATLAIVGGVHLQDGVYYVWTIISDEVRGHGLALTRTLKKILFGASITEKINRYVAVVDSSISENVRWAEVMGFHRRHRLGKYVQYVKEM